MTDEYLERLEAYAEVGRKPPKTRRTSADVSADSFANKNTVAFLGLADMVDRYEQTVEQIGA